MSPIHCGNCGGKIKLPAGYAKAKIRCDACGYYAAVPDDLRAKADDAPAPAPPPPAKRARPASSPEPDAEPAPPPRRTVVAPVAPVPTVRARTDPRDARPEFVPQDNTGTPYLEGTQDEDDDRPYGVAGDGLKRCPDCQGELPHTAAFCVHCGSHMDGTTKEARPKKKRTYSEMDESFGEGFPRSTRLVIFAAAQVLNMLVAALGLAAGGKWDATAVLTGGAFTLLQSAMQAFVIGTYDTLRVQRNEKGKGTLSRVRRYLFFPLPPARIEWKHCHGVGRLAHAGGGIIDWIICCYLLTMGVLPGVLFWWFVLKPEKYHVAMCNEYRGIEETVFHGKDQAQAEAVLAVVADATGLRTLGIL